MDFFFFLWGKARCKKDQPQQPFILPSLVSLGIGGDGSAKDPVLFSTVCLTKTEGSSSQDWKWNRKLDVSHSSVLCLPAEQFPPSTEEALPLSNSLSCSGSWLPKYKHRSWEGFPRAKARRHQGMHFCSLGTSNREPCLHLFRQPFIHCFWQSGLYEQAHDPMLRGVCALILCYHCPRILNNFILELPFCK